MHFLIIFCATYVIAIIVLLWVLVWYLQPKENRYRFLISTISAGIIAFVLSRIAGKLYFDPRPFVSQHTTPLIAHAADNGFPSDHALFTMTLTVITYFFNKKIASAMLVLSILVGAARVLAKVHSPIDIAGAWVLASIGAVAGFYAGRWAWNAYRQKRSSSTHVGTPRDQ